MNRKVGEGAPSCPPAPPAKSRLSAGPGSRQMTARFDCSGGSPAARRFTSDRSLQNAKTSQVVMKMPARTLTLMRITLVIECSNAGVSC